MNPGPNLIEPNQNKAQTYIFSGVYYMGIWAVYQSILILSTRPRYIEYNSVKILMLSFKAITRGFFISQTKT